MNEPDQIANNRLTKMVRDIRQRMVRTESRVTSFMRYHGFRPGVDLDAERVDRVHVDLDRMEVHVTSPDVPLGLILDGVIDADEPRLSLFVCGVRCGTIEPSQPIEEVRHDAG